MGHVVTIGLKAKLQESYWLESGLSTVLFNLTVPLRHDQKYTGVACYRWATSELHFTCRKLAGKLVQIIDILLGANIL